MPPIGDPSRLYQRVCRLISSPRVLGGSPLVEQPYCHPVPPRASVLRASGAPHACPCVFYCELWVVVARSRCVHAVQPSIAGCFSWRVLLLLVSTFKQQPGAGVRKPPVRRSFAASAHHGDGNSSPSSTEGMLAPRAGHAPAPSVPRLASMHEVRTQSKSAKAREPYTPRRRAMTRASAEQEERHLLNGITKFNIDPRKVG